MPPWVPSTDTDMTVQSDYTHNLIQMQIDTLDVLLADLPFLCIHLASVFISSPDPAHYCVKKISLARPIQALSTCLRPETFYLLVKVVPTWILYFTFTADILGLEWILLWLLPQCVKFYSHVQDVLNFIFTRTWTLFPVFFTYPNCSHHCAWFMDHGLQGFVQTLDKAINLRVVHATLN